MDMFNRRPSSGHAGSVKTWVIERLGLDDSDLVTVAELVCHEPDCPPVETLISVYDIDGNRRDWRMHKSIAEITKSDVQNNVAGEEGT